MQERFSRVASCQGEDSARTHCEAALDQQKASEDRDEWVEEVQVDGERCYDDKHESSQVQEERIQEQRGRVECEEAWEGKKVVITVGRVLRGTWDVDEE